LAAAGAAELAAAGAAELAAAGAAELAAAGAAELAAAGAAELAAAGAAELADLAAAGLAAAWLLTVTVDTMVVGMQVLMVTTDTAGEELAGLAGAAIEDAAGEAGAELAGLLDCIIAELVFSGLLGADLLDDSDIGMAGAAGEEFWAAAAGAELDIAAAAAGAELDGAAAAAGADGEADWVTGQTVV